MLVAARMDMHRIVRIVGSVYLALAIALIAIGDVSIWYFNGVSVLRGTMNPLNFINDLAVMATLAPGALLLAWAKMLKAKASQA